MEIGDLAIGMDSGIRPAGALDFHRLSGYPGKKALQLPLYSILRRSGGRGIPFSLSALVSGSFILKYYFKITQSANLPGILFPFHKQLTALQGIPHHRSRIVIRIKSHVMRNRYIGKASQYSQFSVVQYI